MARKTVTIRDVAAASGFSIYTVSCVLNNKGNISQPTREKVQKAIHQLGYDPLRNIPLASRLNVKTLAVVLPSLYCEGHPFYFRAMSTARQFATEHQWDVKLFTQSDLSARLADNRARLITLGFDAMIAFCCDVPASVVRAILDRGVPTALIRRSLPVRSVMEITDDDRRGVRLAVEHLHQVHGHRRIGFVANQFSSGAAPLRKESFIEIMREFDIEPDPDLFIETRGVEELQDERLAGLCRAGRCTAILCIDDMRTVRSARSLLSRGLRIPEDVAVIGYNNDSLAGLFYPGLTTIDIPVEAMVQAACRGFLEYDPKAAAASGKLLFDNALITRESCGCGASAT